MDREETVTTEVEARMYILTNCRNFKNRQIRNDKFRESFERVASDFPGVTSRKEKVKLTRDSLMSLFAGFGTYIVLKAKHLETRSKLFEEYEALVVKIKKLDKYEDIIDAQMELGTMEDELMAAEKPLSFASSPPDVQKALSARGRLRRRLCGA